VIFLRRYVILEKMNPTRMPELKERAPILTRLLTKVRHLSLWSGLWVAAALIAFVYSISICATFLHSPVLSTLDYPIQIISTFRILHGEVPYRDFQTLYGPLGYYIAAAFIWPLRVHTPVNGANCYVVACLTIFYAILCTALARLRLRRPVFLVGSATLVAASAPFFLAVGWYSLPMLLPVVFATITLQFTVPSPIRSPARALLWQSVTGALLAAQMFIRFNFGLYPIFAIAVVAAAAYFFGDRRIAAAGLRCLAFTVGFLALLSMVFAAEGILVPFLSDMRMYLIHNAAGRTVPWKYVDHTIVYATAASFIATLLRSLPRIFRRRIDFSLVPYITLSGFLTYTIVRFDTVHLLPFLALSLLLLADPSGDAPSKGTQPWYRSCFGLPELQLFGLILLLQLLSPMRYISGLEWRLLHIPAHTFSIASQHPGVVFGPQPVTGRHQVALYTSEADMLDRLDKLRKPTDEVFWMSAPDACQSTFDMCTNLGLYLADNMLPREPVWYFDTPTTPYPALQQHMIEGLQANRTPWVGVQEVYVPNPIGGPSVRSSLLIDYVRSHYSLVFTTEIPNRNIRYLIYSRRL
jgi:hypothetical protein